MVRMFSRNYGNGWIIPFHGVDHTPCMGITIKAAIFREFG